VTAPRLRLALLGMLLAGFSGLASESLAAAKATLRVEGETFVLTLADGKRLTSTDLVGAELETQDGQTIRIDAVAPAKERPSLLLHSFSVLDATTKTWTPVCDPDAYGRRVGFPVAGRWNGRGNYIKDPAKWFLACTAGSRGKCIVWGYDPWGRGPRQEDLAPLYRACQFTVRANYDGRGEAHTRDGTEIDLADIFSIQTHESLTDPRFTFEAGWGPRGAVCVAATRWPDLLPLEALLKSTPRLGGPCTEEKAKRRGALIFTRIVRR
jgi:hypothetical protein